MIANKKILELATALQSTALVGENIKVLKKKKKESKDFIGMGVKNIIGTQLIKEQADIMGTL